MPRFIQTNEGWVNLDCVGRITKNRGDQPTVSLFAPDGTPCGKAWIGDVELDEELATIIPATIPVTAYVFYVEHSDTRPTEDNIWVETHNVIAWRIYSARMPPVPVLVDTVSGTVMILRPDGAVDDIYNAQYKDLAAAKASVLLEAQQSWDGRASAPVSSA